ncbi:type II toxin-antitoxin system RelE/ParE family toxin, partial [Candidatus Aeolococcus gillhamiae]
QIVVLPPAVKVLRQLGRVDRRRIEAAVDRLPTGDVKPPGGRSGEWRLRVCDWRVIYRLDGEQRLIVILAVRPRGSAYKP